MTSTHLADEIRRSLSGPMWHGSSVNELLDGVTHEDAIRRPIASAHTIRELVLHMTVWTDVARRRGQGQAVSPTMAEDWPQPGDLSARGWKEDRDRLTQAHESLARFAEELSEKELEATVAGHDYTLGGMLHGVIEHDCYHGGQIALLKKLIGEGSR